MSKSKGGNCAKAIVLFYVYEKAAWAGSRAALKGWYLEQISVNLDLIFGVRCILQWRLFSKASHATFLDEPLRRTPASRVLMLSQVVTVPI